MFLSSLSRFIIVIIWKKKKTSGMFLHARVSVLFSVENVEQRQTAGRFSIFRLYFSEKLFDEWPRATPDIDEVDP